MVVEVAMNKQGSLKEVESGKRVIARPHSLATFFSSDGCKWKVVVVAVAVGL